jgi:hypothetical protein
MALKIQAKIDILEKGNDLKNMDEKPRSMTPY